MRRSGGVSAADWAPRRRPSSLRALGVHTANFKMHRVFVLSAIALAWTDKLMMAGVKAPGPQHE
jgi:hypothetical protein